jgi:hypothetical protein
MKYKVVMERSDEGCSVAVPGLPGRRLAHDAASRQARRSRSARRWATVCVVATHHP